MINQSKRELVKEAYQTAAVCIKYYAPFHLAFATYV